MKKHLVYRNLSFMATLGLILALLLSACNAPSASSTPSGATSSTASSVPVTTTSGSSTSTPTSKTKVNIAAMKGPTAMGLVKLMDDNEKSVASNDYNFSLVGAADEVSAGLINGSLDIAAVPANLASVLYNRTEGKIKVLALNTLGALYILEAGNSIQSVADLKGKTILSTGKGTTPEYCLNYILAQNGLQESDVTIEFKAEATEIATLLQQGAAKIAVLPEPMVTTTMAKNSDLRIALDFTAEWENVKGEGGSMVAGTYVSRSEFIEKNQVAVNTFLEEAATSIAYTEANLDSTADLVAKYEITPSAAVAIKAIPNCNIIYRDGEELQADLSGYLKVLFAANPQSVGGRLPDADFYYQK